MPMNVNVSLRGFGTLAIWIIALFVFVPEFIAALKDVSVTIPQAVRRGGNALFICNYDMENDTLYSVKWYKGRREFYRYTPKENPAMKTFLSAGIDVERNLSNQSHVVLLAVPLNISGKFTCEISVEAPSFLTAMVSGEMEVVELPEQRPVVTGIHSRYRLGDLVDGNCSIKFSKPAANLTWTINGVVVPPHHIKMHQIERYPEHNLESVYSEIGFMVTTQHFIKGQMKLKCTASIFNIYKEEVEKVIEEDRPRIMASGRSFDMNAYPYDQQSSGDFEDHNESYLTYYSAADVSSSATSMQSTGKGLGRTIQRLASTLQRFVVSASSASLSSITNVSRRLVARRQIEDLDISLKTLFLIATFVAARRTPKPVIEQTEDNAIGPYAALIMLTIAAAVVVGVILSVRWRFNDFLSTEEGYYYSPRRHRHHHYSDNEIDTNRAREGEGGAGHAVMFSPPGQRQQPEHLQHQCHQHQKPPTMEQQREQPTVKPSSATVATITDSHRLLLLLPMARPWVDLDRERINHHSHVQYTTNPNATIAIGFC